MSPSDIDEIHEILFRLGVATLMGGILGVDRDLHRKPAGVRVLAMVSVGACAITMASITSFSGLDKPAGDGILRTVQGVLSGIGFLGAGVIMRAQGKDEVHGLTTAASIWIVAILGMISGLGQWLLSIGLFGTCWMILVFGRWIEGKVLSWAPLPNSSDSSRYTVEASPVEASPDRTGSIE